MVHTLSKTVLDVNVKHAPILVQSSIELKT